MNSHIYHGKKYNSVVQLAKAAGVDRTALNRAILKNKNTPVEELIQKIKDSKVSYNYKGKVYFSIREASKDLDLKPETISKYLKLSNNDLEVAMNLYLDEHTYAIVDGVRYSSGDDLAKALGVTRTTLDKYVKLAAESSITTDENAEKNATMAESIKIAVENIKKMKETKFFWKDKEYTSFSALARAMGMSTPTLHRYLDLYKESSLDEIYELYNTLNAGKYKTYTYGEKEYSSLKNMLKDLGISTQTYYRELSQNGGNSKQAIAQLLQKKEEEIAKKEAALLAIEQREKNKPTYIFNGKAYSSKAEVAKLANISESQASRLLDEYDNNLDIALEHKKEKIIYNYGGKEYPSIVALAEATGIKEARLGRYIRKYDRDAEKAILMITLRDSRRKNQKKII